MPTWMLAFVFAAGFAIFIYYKLLHATGEPSARRDAVASLVAFALVYLILFTFFKYVLGFS